MFNPIQVVVDAFVEQLQKQYEQIYGMLEPANPGIMGSSRDWQWKILQTVMLHTTT
jgi:hypothetical protein